MYHIEQQHKALSAQTRKAIDLAIQQQSVLTETSSVSQVAGKHKRRKRNVTGMSEQVILSLHLSITFSRHSRSRVEQESLVKTLAAFAITKGR